MKTEVNLPKWYTKPLHNRPEPQYRGIKQRQQKPNVEGDTNQNHGFLFLEQQMLKDPAKASLAESSSNLTYTLRPTRPGQDEGRWR